MPADEIEVREGDEEGIIRHNSIGPARILRDVNGKVTGVEFKRCLRVFDENRRFNQIFDENERTVIEADTVILSIGQSTDLSFLDPWYCDLPPGEPITWGVQTEACECADWFNAKYIIMWGSNVVQTRIPDAHFAYEARYNGAKLCVISPDYNSSAIHADHFLQIQPGTDAMLAMGLARLLVENNWVDRPYITEQTDMPMPLDTCGSARSWSSATPCGSAGVVPFPEAGDWGAPAKNWSAA